MLLALCVLLGASVAVAPIATAATVAEDDAGGAGPLTAASGSDLSGLDEPTIGASSNDESGAVTNDGGPAAEDERATGPAVGSSSSQAPAASSADRSARFLIVATDVPRTVTAGETVTVNAIVENVGDQSDEQTVTFAVDGEQKDETTISLTGAGTHTVSFSYETGADDVGDLEIALATDDVVDERTIVVEPGTDPASFQVEITDVPESVVTGESVDVEAVVENVGDVECEQTISFTVDGEQVDETTLDLDAGEDQRVTFGYETDDTDAGTITVAVASDDDADERTVAVLEPAWFDVEIVDAPEEVYAGDTVSIEATVENVGDLTDEQLLSFAVGDAVDGEIDSELSGGDVRTLALEYRTTDDDVGLLNVTVASADDQDRHAIRVLEDTAPASFEIDITDAPEEVEAGDVADVTAVVENVGDVADEQNVTFAVDDQVVETTPTALDGGEAKTHEFAYETDEDDVGELTVEVTSEDDTDRRTVTVLEPARFDVALTDAPAAVTAGDAIGVEAEIANVGAVADEQDVSFAVDDSEIESKTVDLAAGESTSIAFTYETDEHDVGELTVEVASEDDAAQHTVTVREPASFDVEITDAPSAIEVGDEIEIEAVVENVGDVADEQDLTLAVDGDIVETTTVELDDGDAETLAFTYETDEGDVGDLTVEVASEDDEDQRTITVLESPTFSVDIVDAPDTVETGDVIEIGVVVENVGDVAGEQDVTFAVDGQIHETKTLELDGGEDATLTFDYETDENDVGEVTVEVASEDDADQRTVTVESSPFFEVAIDDAPSSVEAGETIELDATVENVGDVAGEQEITFAADDSVVEATTLGLQGAESESLAFDYETDEHDVGEVTLEVASHDDADQRTVTVEEAPGVDVITDVWLHADRDVDVRRGNFHFDGDIVAGGEYRQAQDAVVDGNYEVREGANVDRTPHDDVVDGLIADGAGQFVSIWDDRYDPAAGCDSEWTCDQRVIDEAGTHYVDDFAVRDGHDADVTVDLGDVDAGETIDVVVDGDVLLQSADLEVRNYDTGAIRLWVAGDVTVQRGSTPTVGAVGSDGTNARALQVYGTSQTDVVFEQADVQFEGVVSAPGDDSTFTAQRGNHELIGAIDTGDAVLQEQRIVGQYDPTLAGESLGTGITG